MLNRRILSLVSSGLLLFAAALPVFAQTEPDVQYPVHSDISPALRDIVSTVQPPAGRISLAPMPIPRTPVSPQIDPVLQTTPGPASNAAPGVSFDGVGAPNTCNCAPPDTNMAAGPNHLVQWVNSSYAVYDKAGVIFPGYPKAGSSIWSGFGAGECNNNSGDPVAQYDRAADRWLLTQLSLGNSNFQCVAVSTTNDPTGTYARYSYSFGSDLNDYPKFSVWPVPFTGAPQGAYFASYNIFAFGAFFSGPRPCAYDRQAMLSGAASATQVCFQQGSSVGSLLPTDLDGATPPPNGEPGFYFDYGTNELLMWKFTPNFATPSSSSFTGPTHIAVSAFNALSQSVPQSPGDGTRLDTLSDRLMYRNAYRNFGDHEAVFVSHSVDAGTGGGVRWYELRDPNGAVSKFQDGTFAPDSGFRWMGSVATDQNGDIAIGYSTSSSAMHPAIRYTGREPGDPLGTMQTENSIIEGTGSQTGGLSRWGDYSSLRIDPSDDCTFWYTTEYIQTDGSFNWRTRVGSFRFASCLPPPPPLPPSGLTANGVAAHEVDLAWTDNSNNESGFKIERCTGHLTDCVLDSSFSQIASVAANVTTYQDTTVAPSTTYTYRVRAFNGGGNSPYSNSAEATTGQETAPAAPTNLTASAVKGKAVGVNLSWTDNSNNETNFDIERCAGTGCTTFAPLASVGANVTTYRDNGPFVKRTQYSYRVKARNGTTSSAYSNTASIKPN